MNKHELARKLLKQPGKFGNVKFVKQNGELRSMNFEYGVKKHLRGGTSTTSHKDNLVTVFDVQKGEYRCVNIDTIREIKVNGETYDFTEES